MTLLLTEFIQKAEAYGEQAGQQMGLELIKIEAGALREAASYLQEKPYRTVILAADNVTYEAAGKTLHRHLQASSVSVHITIIQPDRQGDVIADEASLIQLITDIKQNRADAVVAVGGGTLHDIVRYSAYISGIPFISVPTAPSVDGFNSKGAPVLIRGEKLTIRTIGPDAVFADLDVLVQAPAALAAAGFGDMLGKYTSLFDWKFGSVVAGEPYMQAAAEITRSALLQCVKHADQIAGRQEEGIAALITALIESGLAMLLLGHSHPASGAEHHLSHYWEMEYIRLGRRQLLHGAKVGVACIEISNLYRRIAQEGAAPWANISPGEHGENAVHNRIAANWETLQQELRSIPDEETLAGLLRQTGGPVSVQELGINSELLERSLREAHHVRLNRYTLLRAYNERSSAGK